MGIAMLCAYAGALVFLSRRGGDKGAPSSFFVNSRSSGTLGVAFSLIVSCVGASATMGMAGMAWSIGTPAFWWLGAGAAGMTMLALFLAAKVRESGSYTMPEMTERLLGPRARIVVSIIIVVAWMAILAAQFSALSKLIASLAGFSALPCLAIGFFLVVVHTLGGQAVVIRTDRLQFYMLIGGLGVLMYWLNSRNPGWMTGVRIQALNEAFGLSDLLHYLFVVGGNYLVCPMLFGRFLSARDSNTARRAGLLAGLGLLLCSILVVAVGLSCRGLIAPDTMPDAVLTTALDTVFPRWLAVVVLLSLISAVVSSADSCLVTAATVLGYDLLRTDNTAICRGCIVGLGCVGMALTFMQRDILGFLFMAYDVYVAGVVMPVFMALLLGNGRPIPQALSLTALVTGGILGCLAPVLDVPILSIAGMLISGSLILIGLIRQRLPQSIGSRK